MTTIYQVLLRRDEWSVTVEASRDRVYLAVTRADKVQDRIALTLADAKRVAQLLTDAVAVAHDGGTDV